MWQALFVVHVASGEDWWLVVFALRQRARPLIRAPRQVSKPPPGTVNVSRGRGWGGARKLAFDPHTTSTTNKNTPKQESIQNSPAGTRVN